DDEIQSFKELFSPSTPGGALVAMLRRSVTEMVDDMFSSRDVIDTVLRLLVVRHYLSSVVRHVQNHSEKIAAAFPEIGDLVYERARLHGAALLLAMETCEKLRGTGTVVERLVPFKRASTLPGKEEVARA
ncbi:MAG TPA: hypothetical protein VFV49_15840, partial [Thermoanaerobaculia bacterium]|nr:hypothetical protein [Thermoanaerobaculia bacterium]